MKATVYSIDGKALKEIDAPIFDASYRSDLIKRAVLSEESKLRQPKGSYVFAGLETSARYRGRKDDFGTVKNRGIPHLPHEVLPKGQTGKVKRIPGSVKGRRAHPPKVQTKYVELLNKKEHLKAFASAISITANKETVSNRLNSEIALNLPIIMEEKFEKIAKTKDVEKVFSALNLKNLLDKAKKNGTKSALIIVSDKGNIKGGANLPGVDVVRAKDVKVKDLAPGTHPGRLTLFSESALPEIAKRLEA